VTSKKKPKHIIVSTLYYLDESPSGGWADPILNALGYNSNPGKLQSLIQQIHFHATEKIPQKISNAIPFKMYEHMNGKDPKDYVDRVEPSEHGGAKLAKGYYELISKL